MHTVQTISNRLSRQIGPAVVLCLSLAVARGQPVYQQIKSFGSAQLSATAPTSRPLNGSDGRWYWTTSGGIGTSGAILGVNADGGGLTVVHRFASSESVGPFGDLCEDSDGTLYGFTQLPLSLYRINKDGSGFSVLRSFAGTEGSYRSAGVVEGTNGVLYGTAQQGGSHSGGTIFRLDKSGANFLVLRHFQPAANDGISPEGVLLAASNGVLYGTTRLGGTNQGGTIYRLNADGTEFAFLHHFGFDIGGNNPAAGLFEASDGALYGITSFGGSNDMGTLFKLNKDGGNFKTLFHFSPLNYHSELGLTEGEDGALYGVAHNYDQTGSSRVFIINKDGTGYRSLRHFSPGNWTTGMTRSAGSLFGVTFDDIRGNGSLFRLNTNGGGFALVSAYGIAGGDGCWPSSGLIELTDGALCGTTENGGTNFSGTVFRLNKNGGDYAILHHFTTGEGEPANAGVTEASDGMLYGTTILGGTNRSGTIFKMKPDGADFQILHHFDWKAGDSADGEGRLAEAADGKLYGTTSSSVFRLNKDGSEHEVIHRFPPSGAGNRYPGPNAIIIGADAVLYGTTKFGGSNDFGTVFRLDRDGTGFEILHYFDNWDGELPFAPLLEGSDGRLYGTTWGGGTNHAGVAFGLDKTGANFRVLHFFQAADWRDGAIPNAGVTEGRDGALYGTTLRVDLAVGEPSSNWAKTAAVTRF